MRAIKRIVSAETIAGIIDLPWKSTKDLQVELTVKPLQDTQSGWQQALDEGAITVDEFCDDLLQRIAKWPDGTNE